MIAIIDYGVGNIQNVQNAFERLGVETLVTSNPEIILSAQGAVLPGVGAFKDAMKSLIDTGLDKIVLQRVKADKATLGICLGMQLMCEESFEDGQTKGLGIFKGSVKRLEVPYKVPHMGWNTLETVREDPFVKNLPQPSYAYFVHSYYLTGYRPEDVLQIADYGVKVPATLRKGSVFAMQFHPEKSGDAGQVLLENFLACVDQKAMKLYPAIDIKNGKCVRLYQGSADSVTEYGDNPVEMAKRWIDNGAKRLHLVDLDGAFSGSGAARASILNIRKNVDIPLQVGGGIRSLEDVQNYLESGIDRVIVGTIAITDLNLLKELVNEYGSKIIVSVDAKDGMVTTDGWVKSSETKASDLLEALNQIGVQTVVYTDISRDGAMTGPNIDALVEANTVFSGTIIASGGISCTEDLVALRQAGIRDAIVGKALYEGAIDLKTAQAQLEE